MWLKNIGMVSQKQYRNTFKTCVTAMYIADSITVALGIGQCMRRNTAAGKLSNGVISLPYDNSDVIITLTITNVHLFN